MRRSPEWDLRVATALLSLDVVDPFLPDLGFRRTQAWTVRRVAREFLDPWRPPVAPKSRKKGVPQQSPQEWLSNVRSRYGRSVAGKISALSDTLATENVNAAERLAWTELLVRLDAELTRGSVPSVGEEKLGRLGRLARSYLTSMARLDSRLESDLRPPRSNWDKQLLSRAFYREGGRADDRFDPEPWLAELLKSRLWTRYRNKIKEVLAASEISALVAWGKTLSGFRLTNRLSVLNHDL